MDLIEIAYFAYSIHLTYNAAKVLSRDAEANKLKALQDSVRNAFVESYFDKEGKLTTEFQTQTGYLMALAFELVSEDMAEKMVPNLIQTIEDADNHLRTGFLGTPLLAIVLSKYQQSDLMYKILFQESYPSWFYSINQGATTIWERWNSYSHKDGFGDSGMNSFNHYAYGAIGQWMYEGIAGISPLEPGYKKILIAPTPGKQLQFAKAEYNSVYGKIISDWKKIDEGLKLKVIIPPNTTARVIIPASDEMELLSNGENFVNNSNAKLMDKSNDRFILEVSSGEYNFVTKTE